MHLAEPYSLNFPSVWDTGNGWMFADGGKGRVWAVGVQDIYFWDFWYEGWGSIARGLAS